MLRTNNYAEYNDFRIWCIKHKPSLLESFSEPFLSLREWDLLRGMQSKNINYKNNTKPIIAYFLSEDNNYLYWHCPIEFIREYLEKQCGYKKANWFIKLFWKK